MPDKDPSLIVHQDEPLNAEPPPERLTDGFVTPTPLFFVRNHAPVPTIDPEDYRLRVTGRVTAALRLSLDELLGEFEPVAITATLQCAGNRRDELMKVRAIPDEVPWGPSAIGTARWRGVLLRDVLRAAGLADDARHVAFTGLDRVSKSRGEGETGETERTEAFGFGGSIPVEKALDDVLLAYEMNGESLPPLHGFPLRAVVPGYIGARSVKWLGEIEARERPSENHYQARAYKLFPPDVSPETAEWERGLSLGALPVNAVITRPRPGTTVSAGRVRIEGYAVAGAGRTVERVDLSTDGGASWHEAELRGTSPDPDEAPSRARQRGRDRALDAPAASAERSAWRLWSRDVELPSGDHELVVRCWDSSADTQPERAEPIWNFKGYISNAWHRVGIHVT